MLVSRDPDVIKQARFLATQARDPAPHYEHSTYGYNYRMSNICAAIGLGQAKVLDERVATRRKIFERYKSELTEGFTFMPEPKGYKSSHWLTTAHIDPDILGVTREDIRMALLSHEIESRPLWKPMHMQPLFAGRKYYGSGVDEDLFTHGLCLPSGSNLSDAQQSEIISHIKNLIASR